MSGPFANQTEVIGGETALAVIEADAQYTREFSRGVVRQDAVALRAKRNAKKTEEELQRLQAEYSELAEWKKHEEKQKKTDEKERKKQVMNDKRELAKALQFAQRNVAKTQSEVARTMRNLQQTEQKVAKETAKKIAQREKLDEVLKKLRDDKHRVDKLLEGKMADVGEAQGRLEAIKKALKDLPEIDAFAEAGAMDSDVGKPPDFADSQEAEEHERLRQEAEFLRLRCRELAETQQALRQELDAARLLREERFERRARRELGQQRQQLEVEDRCFAQGQSEERHNEHVCPNEFEDPEALFAVSPTAKVMAQTVAISAAPLVSVPGAPVLGTPDHVKMPVRQAQVGTYTQQVSSGTDAGSLTPSRSATPLQSVHRSLAMAPCGISITSASAPAIPRPVNIPGVLPSSATNCGSARTIGINGPRVQGGQAFSLTNRIAGAYSANSLSRPVSSPLLSAAPTSQTWAVASTVNAFHVSPSLSQVVSPSPVSPQIRPQNARVAEPVATAAWSARARGSITDSVFDAVDRDHDGTISRQELRAALHSQLLAAA